VPRKWPLEVMMRMLGASRVSRLQSTMLLMMLLLPVMKIRPVKPSPRIRSVEKLYITLAFTRPTAGREVGPLNWTQEHKSV